jgi:hypothetical protein
MRNIPAGRISTRRSFAPPPLDDGESGLNQPKNKNSAVSRNSQRRWKKAARRFSPICSRSREPAAHAFARQAFAVSIFFYQTSSAMAALGAWPAASTN